MNTFLILLIVSLLLFIIWYMRRVNTNVGLLNDRITHVSQTHLNNLYRQIESLLSLYTTLGFNIGLPPMRGWAASPDFLVEILNHALAAKPQVVVECSSGVSTLVLARALQMNGAGHVYSMESGAEFAQATRDQLRLHGLETWATVFDAPLRNHSIKGKEWSWYSVEVLPNDLAIDMLVIDGPVGIAQKNIRYPASPNLFPKLRAGAVVFLDDADRDDEREIVTAWEKEWSGVRVSRSSSEKGCVKLSFANTGVS